MLEPAAQQIAAATAQPPYLYDLGPEGARKVLDDIQAAPMDKPDIDEKWITVPDYNGTLHDFMMLNPLRGTAATTHAVEQAIHVLRTALARR